VRFYPQGSIRNVLSAVPDRSPQESCQPPVSFDRSWFTEPTATAALYHPARLRAVVIAPRQAGGCAVEMLFHGTRYRWCCGVGMLRHAGCISEEHGWRKAGNGEGERERRINATRGKRKRVTPANATYKREQECTVTTQTNVYKYKR